MHVKSNVWDDRIIITLLAFTVKQCGVHLNITVDVYGNVFYSKSPDDSFRSL